jgi:hypothetical protein
MEVELRVPPWVFASFLQHNMGLILRLTKRPLPLVFLGTIEQQVFAEAFSTRKQQQLFSFHLYPLGFMTIIQTKCIPCEEMRNYP